MDEVLLPDSSSLVSLRLLFTVGAAFDPPGKAGLAALTAACLAGGGSRLMKYEEIVRAMYPMATAFAAQVDKEMTVFIGATHVDNLPAYYEIISAMLLDPGWREDDFKRLREDAINFLRINLREQNDEELGKEELYNFIYTNHPYGHHNLGCITALERITLADVQQFYHQHYTQANLIIGLAGGYEGNFSEQIKRDMVSALPLGNPSTLAAPEPEVINGLQWRVIAKETRGVAISFGHPISITRAHADWPALLVAQSHFGQHRSSNSHLYQRLRQVRGLNYGDYAYLEYFPRGMYLFHPDPNLARQQQIFQVWIRPVEPANARFALRAALFELHKLVTEGMTEEQFIGTRQFLMKFVNLLTKSQDARLGYALDSRFYGIPAFSDYIRQQLRTLTCEEVNRVIRKYLQSENLKIVVVTDDASGFRQAIIENLPSPIHYASLPPSEVLEEDRIIERYDLPVTPKAIEIIQLDRVFQ